MASQMLATVFVAAALLPWYASATLAPSPVTDWIYLLQQHLRDTKLQNQVGSKYYGLLSLSVYNALKVNRGGNENRQPTAEPRWNETAVVAFASHTLLTHWFPWWYNQHDLLIQKQLKGLDAVDHAGAKALGESEANKVTLARVGDGYARWAAFEPATFNVTGSIGRYQFTPNQTFALYPQYGFSRPLVLSFSDIDVIVNKYKNKFHGYFQSDEYYADLNETRTVGGQKSERSAYDTETPTFWAGGPGTALIHGQFINISVSVLPDTYDIFQQARFFAQLGVAISDSSVACYRTKYETLAWRVVTAIQLGDGTDKYEADPTWLPLLATPPHPSYPSGHQCISQPAVDVIANALGTSEAAFSIGSEGIVNGTLRNFTNLDQIIVETTASRIFGGVHFKRDNTDGLELGKDATKLVLARLR